MQIPLSKVLKDSQGRPFLDGEKPLTVQMALLGALDAPNPNKEPFSLEEIRRRNRLHKKVSESAGEYQNFTVDEAHALRNYVLAGWPYPRIVAQIDDLIEGSGEAAPSKD